MRIISFGDVHEDTSNLIKIKSELENADLIIISGDLSNYHGKAAAKKVLESVKKYNKHLLAQYGNLDQPDVNEYLTGEGINLHGNGYIFGDVGIFGCGASSQTPFNTPSEISEADIERFLTNGYNKVKNAKWKIMVCHTPPKDTAIDVIRSGLHVGSSVVRDFIVQYKPDVCISGHIHESRGREMLGNTIILNAGMFRDGWYIEIIIEKNNLTAVLKSVA
ncbi:MAG: metallophosphoesterase [Candidatus Brocadiaceae bacterium]|nr:metallophosphoesterase [Candidatus Brocadiaceae bacterium]